MSIDRSVGAIYPKRSSFNRDRLKKFDADFGYLIPIEIQTMYPGDKVKLSADSLIRTLPLVCPPYTAINAYINAYFVAYRALHENFEGYITGGEDGLNDYILPTVSPKVQFADSSDTPGVDFPILNSSWDYLGFPMHPFIRDFSKDPDINPVARPQIFRDGTIPLMKYPFMAIDNIWNEYYRNQNLEEEIELGSSAFTLPNRVHWSKDYFTDSLPFQQRGPAPAIPIVGNMQLMLDNISLFGMSNDFVGAGSYEYSQSVSASMTSYRISSGNPGTTIICPTSVVLTAAHVIPECQALLRVTSMKTGTTEVSTNSHNLLYNPANKTFTADSFNPAFSSSYTYSFEFVFRNNVVTAVYSVPLAQNVPGAALLQNQTLYPGLIYTFLCPDYDNVLKSSNPSGYKVVGNLTGDATGLTAASISDLRTAFQCQLWMERNARAGVRYCEFIQSHFGIHPSDERLQRPEYIGGTKFPIIINEVIQQSESTSSSPLGSLGGRGIGGTENGYIGTYSAKEFGVLVVTMHIKPVNEYSSQGIERQFTPRSKFDFYSPEFSHLAMQGIRNSELFVDVFNSELNGKIFGYTGIWDDLRDTQSQVCGNLRPDIGTFGYWSLARSFSSTPTLTEDFIKCNPDKRIFAVQNENPFICLVNIKQQWLRPLPRVGEPGYLDHPYI